MKVLLFWPYFYPDLSGVACSNRGEAFAKYCNKHGINVYVITPKRKNNGNVKIDNIDYSVDRIKTYNTVGESHSFLVSLLYFPVSVTRLLKVVKKIKPDVIISSTPGPFMPLEGLIVAKYLNIPYIFDMQDSWHLTRYSHRGTVRNNIKMFLERLCAIYSNSIFTVTPSYKKIISEGYNLDQDKLKLVYNGVNLEPFSNLEKNEIIDLIHLGSPRIYYDTIKLIDAFSIIVQHSPRTKLSFIGCTNENYVQETRKYAEEKGLLDNIDFTPLIPYEKVPHELAKAKIGIISIIDRPEYKAPIGVKVLEYMAAGLPTAYLGPSGSEQEKMIIDNNVGIVASNATDFAEKVTSLMNDRSRRDLMGKQAKSCIKKYTWEKIVTEAIEEDIRPLVH